mmetsp:Transcript_25039/g.42649  ORF Transcript_25039/g.42649 Transcript_25039/m.42649 type:complete len:288 (-) Transcript_25039:987-1850(-)
MSLSLSRCWISRRHHITLDDHRRMRRRMMALRLLVLFIVCIATSGKDRNVPHPHRGVLRPYNPGPFDISLSGDDEQQLTEGKPVTKQAIPQKSDGDPAGGAICIQDIDAPKAAVWNQILRMNEYAGKVPKVKESKNYQFHRNRDGSITMKTRQRLGILPGYTYENYYNHKFEPKKDSLVWSLDYDKSSDFDDCAGHWHLKDHPTKPHATRVFYACDIKLSSAIPTPVLNYIGKSALKQATSWVKKESEAEPDSTVPTEFVTKGASTRGTTRGKQRSLGFLRRMKLEL